MMKDPWSPYEPASGEWTLAKVGHVYRRVGFGASMGELEAGLKLSPQELIGKLLQPGRASSQYDADTEKFLSDSATKFNSGETAAGWWLYRMLYGPHPLREKLSLFWHNHFATSNAKVQNVGYMVGQYQLIYRHAQGKFDELLQGISKDPAMMVWLDTVQSKKGMPNENYARELMELFSLGIGNYTENDIREAAKAFTGWEIRNGQYFANTSAFDDSSKKVFGKTGKFRGEDIVRLCLEKPACPRFIARKLYRFLISETETPEPYIESLAASFAKDFHFGQLVEKVLRSKLFFSETAYRARIKSPVDYVLGMVRGTESKIGTLNGSVNLTQALETLGQNLFHPPSVKGWDGGPTWINGQTLLFRQNLALDIARRSSGFQKPTAAQALVDQHQVKKPEDQARFFMKLFLQEDLPKDTQERVVEYARSASKAKLPSYWSAEERAEHRTVSLCHLVMTLPEYQLD